MSRSFELHVRFSEERARDLCAHYLDHEGSVFEDEVPEAERRYWQLLQDGLPWADEVRPVGATELRIRFEDADDFEENDGDLIPGDLVVDYLLERLVELGMKEGYLLRYYEGNYYFSAVRIELRPIHELVPEAGQERILKPILGDGYVSRGSLTVAAPGWPEPVARAVREDHEDLLGVMIATFEG